MRVVKVEIFKQHGFGDVGGLRLYSQSIQSLSTVSREFCVTVTGPLSNLRYHR